MNEQLFNLIKNSLKGAALLGCNLEESIYHTGTHEITIGASGFVAIDNYIVGQLSDPQQAEIGLSIKKHHEDKVNEFINEFSNEDTRIKAHIDKINKELNEKTS